MSASKTTPNAVLITIEQLQDLRTVTNALVEEARKLGPEYLIYHLVFALSQYVSNIELPEKL